MIPGASCNAIGYPQLLKERVNRWVAIRRRGAVIVFVPGLVMVYLLVPYYADAGQQVRCVRRN